MRPAFSVIFLTTLCGAGQGLFIAVYTADFFYGFADGRFLQAGAWGAAGLAALGLIASFFHLGRLGPAWRAASQWRTSWLSREVILLPAFIAGCGAYALFHEKPWVGFLAFAACLGLFLCTAMIYACLKFLQEWATPLTVFNFFFLGTASGYTLAAALASALAPEWSRYYSQFAIALTIVACAGRLWSLRRNARLRPRSTTQSAIGVHHPRVEQRSQGFTVGSFNTREFFHGRAPQVVRAVRWTFLLLAFPAPALLLASQLHSGSTAVLALAALLQYAGIVAERWYFFAEAKHPQNLYYQAMA